jgi:hypothetical protein
MECVFMRLAMYTKVSMTVEMIDVIVKAMAEVLCILAIATKEMNENRASGFDLWRWIDTLFTLPSERGLRKLAGRKDIDDALQRLDKVTTVEIRTAAAQAHNRGRMGGAEDTLQGIDVSVKGSGDSDEVLNGTDIILSWLDLFLSNVWLLRCRRYESVNGTQLEKSKTLFVT